MVATTQSPVATPQDYVVGATGTMYGTIPLHTVSQFIDPSVVKLLRSYM